MAIKPSPKTASPPPEVVQIIEQFELSQNYVQGWFAVPSINPPSSHVGQAHLCGPGLVDAYQQIAPFLGNKLLTRSLRTMDLLNGCGHQCDVCLANAALPSKMFSFASLKRLFQEPNFLLMLQSSLRFGSSGDLLDHPDAIKIINMILWETRDLDRAIQTRTGNKERFVLKVFTNYRPNLETKLDELVGIALRHHDRLKLVISLPLNKSDIINLKFNSYVVSRPNIFAKKHHYSPDGLLRAESLHRNICVQDVRHPRILFTSGRTLPQEYLANKCDDPLIVEADREICYRDRGLVKTYFNPDALWLMVYTTMYESNTTRAFTPLSPDNLPVFSQLPWHPDFPTPPNWPGKKGAERSWQEADLLMAQTKASGQQPRRSRMLRK